MADMKLETVLDAMVYASADLDALLSYSVFLTPEIQKRQRQYRAFRARILEEHETRLAMDAWKIITIYNHEQALAPQDKRIAELEAEIDEMNAWINNLILARLKQTKRIAELEASLDAFFKVVVIDDKQYVPGHPLCAGCEELTLARGWECYYKPHTTECKYPDELQEENDDAR
jgi:hypothetical protein